MKPYAVTGANGHLGRHLTARLLERTYPVRAIVRSREAALSLEPRNGLTIVQAGLDNLLDLKRAFEGCEGIFHAAAPTSMWARDPFRHISIPIREGSQNVILAAAQGGVKKVVYTSTAATVGLKSDFPTDENTWNETSQHPQFQSKIWVERELTPFAKSLGVNFISLCPPSVIGPGAVKDTPSLRPYRQLVEGRLPFLPPMKFHLLDVRDLAACQIQVMESGHVAHTRYIVGGHYVDLKEVVSILSSSFAQLSLPRYTLPKPFFYLLSLAEALSFPWKQSRELSWNVVNECIGCDQRLDGSRFVKEFGFGFRPVTQTLVDTVEFLMGPTGFGQI